MPGKLRVHELAKQLGVTSKELLATLKEKGEFVKTASSTIEPPVVKKMKEHYASLGITTNHEAPAAKSTQSTPAAKPGAPKPGAGGAKSACQTWTCRETRCSETRCYRETWCCEAWCPETGCWDRRETRHAETGRYCHAG